LFKIDFSLASLSEFDGDDFSEHDLQVYRNLALSRLVKRAVELTAGVAHPNGLTGRSGSRTPELSALWKTRVGRK